MKHELWFESEGEQTFCIAGPHGDSARKLLSAEAKLIWTCEAKSHFEAMQKYYQHMNWGEYTSEFSEIDRKTYAELGWE